MSGYLQRLAGSVMRPMETVHPLVGSVFSPKTRIVREGLPASGNPAMFSDPETRIEPEAVSTVRNAAFINQFQSPERRARAQEADHLGDLPAALISKGEAANPSQRIHSLNSIPDEPASLRPEQAVMRKQAPRTDEPDRAGGTPAVQDTGEPRKSAYPPLMPGSAARSGCAAAPDARSNVVALPERGKHRADTSGRTEHQPDEVQIHIGRIEVSAVPQVPAAASGKVSRKGLSLDEYLKRRDGRTT